MPTATVVQDKIFKALADPSRRAIFESLTRGEAAVKDLTARFDISQPAISQHLAALKDAGLVNGSTLADPAREVPATLAGASPRALGTSSTLANALPPCAG